MRVLVLISAIVVCCSTKASNAQGVLLPVLTHNGTLLTSLTIVEEQTKVIDFFMKGVPAGYSGVLSIVVSSADGFSHLSVTPDSFTVTAVATTDSKPEALSDIIDQLIAANDSSVRTLPDIDSSNGMYYQNNFTITGEFLGFAELKFVLSDDDDLYIDELISEPTPVKVLRSKKVLDIIFIHFIIIMVFVVYINMGCTIDMSIVIETLKRPVAPLIGVTSQFLFMPICSYFLGYLFLGSTPSLWLGLFITGCSPGGGGSNMWTYLLGGSLDLSVTMTFVSTVVAFAMMPLWVWLLADTIYSGGQFDSPPFKNISMLIVGLVIPIAIGLAIKRWLPTIAGYLRKSLKPLALFFIIFVMTFGVYTYWPIFKYFSWKVAVCGFLLPFLGYLAGFFSATITRRPFTEVIAISVETGLQNTGLAIGLMKVALKEFAPIGDIAMVVPIAVATLTPVPLLVVYAFMSLKGRCNSKKSHELQSLTVKNNE